VNGIRRSSGLDGVAADALLSRTAEGWALRLAQKGVLSHRGADGSSAMDRYRALGGTEVHLGEILGSGPGLLEIEKAWLKSVAHRDVVLTRSWTHVGWGRVSAKGVSAKGQEVWVVLFCQKLVEELRIDQGAGGLSVSGRFVDANATGPMLYVGLDPHEPVSWDARSRRFSFQVPAPFHSDYLRLGYVVPGKAFTLTNAFTLPREMVSPEGPDRFPVSAAPP
jgi:hypothetical protein